MFRAMAGEMLFLANQGVEFLRMDAVAIIWKKLGTTCESLSQARTLIRAFTAVCRLAAPSLLFKSEAIVHQNEVVSYGGAAECQISYSPLLMALSWEALVTRDVRLLDQALSRRQASDDRCGWVNYVRSHDDIGWTFADEDAAELGIIGFDHRRFLNSYYVNCFPGSFARGVPFQDNSRTGDYRISGTTASLADVEAGDSGDSRWVHRPHRPAELYAQRYDLTTVAGEIFAGMRHLIGLRQKTPGLAGGWVESVPTGNAHVRALERYREDSGVMVVANFADGPQTVAVACFATMPPQVQDLMGGEALHQCVGLTLRARQFVWLSYAWGHGGDERLSTSEGLPARISQVW